MFTYKEHALTYAATYNPTVLYKALFFLKNETKSDEKYTQSAPNSFIFK